MHPVLGLIEKSERVVAGLMSGTSLDGVDAAIVRLNGSGRAINFELLSFVSLPFETILRSAIRNVSEVESSDVRSISQLNVALAIHFANTAEEALVQAGLKAEDLDLVGSHGQTIQHIPETELVSGNPVRSTLQIGDPATLAIRLNAPVIADFRPADMALGGQGAPLAPYLDDALFSSKKEARGLLNLGGIANLTVLPEGSSVEEVVAFDTGPANMLIDALAQHFFDQPHDVGGNFARKGSVDESLLEMLLAEPFFKLPPPKSTGREMFGRTFAVRFIAEGPKDPHDLLATATALTARSVYHAYMQFVDPHNPIDTLIVSGGGVDNEELMLQLSELFAQIPVRSTLEYGLDPDAKEAVLVAALAHEWANGVPTNLPSVTGASRKTILGSLTLP